MARQPAEGVRDHILDTAAGLFDAHGIRAVGLQQIIDNYGCGKNLFYREFPSKDELVVAYLRRCEQDWQQTAAAAVEEAGDDPGRQLVAIVRTFAAKSNGTRGCALHNTFAEFPDPEHPAHQVTAEHFRSVRAVLRGIAEQTGAPDPGTLADRIMLILDGVYTNGATLGPEGAVNAAVAFAEDVVAAATHKAEH